MLQRSYISISNRKNTKNTRIKLELLSKLAVLELSGWIETTIDQILVEYVSRKICDSDEQGRIRRNIIDRVYGFDLERNVWPLFERVLGVVNCKSMRTKLENTRGYDSFASDITTVHSLRRRQAHTCCAGPEVTRQIVAPSTTWGYFQNIYPIIQRIKRFCEKL